MGKINDQQEGVSSVGAPYTTINWLHVSASNPNATAFGGLALDVNASGTVTTYYYWPNTSGVLRYGTTAPTIATQDTAGSAV